MTQTLLMERVMDQTRLAVIEDGGLCELYVQRPDSENLAGNIYLGRVENVLPGMNAAFVDIGMEKNGFLAAGDIRLFAQGDKELAKLLGNSRIEKLVRPGQELLVQVVKSQPGGKGPRLSSNITLPGRLMVLLADVSYVGVSRKIQSDAERDRLRAVGRKLSAATGNGLILRTAAEGAAPEAVRAEYERLCSLYEEMTRQARFAKAPKLIHDDNDLTLRAVRDMLNDGVDVLWTDDDECQNRASDYAALLSPENTGKIRRHTGDTPLFDLYRVDSQADKALEKFVWLKSGGSLVIEETEALTVIDVNTAKNVGNRAPDDTILRNNCEAAREAMRQLRLRDIGGIIVIDFIDMRKPQDREVLLEVLRECASRDRSHTVVVDMTPLGLVELTRKKARQSLSRQLQHTCSHCSGNGVVPSHETTARRVVRDLWRRRRGGDETPLVVEAAEPVCGWIRKIGTPGGGVTLKASRELEDSEYRIAPANGK